METIGWIGTALVVAAYYPQIHHLRAERCAWGVSIWTWYTWLIASVVLLFYALLRRELLFVAVQIIKIIAIAATIALVHRSNNVCPHHLAGTAMR